ncbi:MAG TPA: hypothetical protein VGG68_05090 [Caulobacteraceae bacterium]|jgi:hypothetical protein
MRHSIRTLALAGALAAITPLAFAAPHGGGGGGMGGMGGAARSMSSPSGHGLTPTTPTPSTVRGPSQTGQPKQSCQAGANYPANTPGNSFNAPGSAFDPNGVADSKYAGTQPQNSRNTASVSQYDVACTH